MKCFVHLSCQSEEALPGATLFLKTIRTGFPTAQIFVVFGQCIPAAVDVVQAAAEKLELFPLDATQIYRAHPVEAHGAFIRSIVERHAGSKQWEQPLAFCDPDVAFWKSIEEIELPRGALFAGRYAQEMEEMGCLMAPRIHPSLVLIPNVRALLTEIQMRAGTRPYVRPFEAFTVQDGGKWRMHDTLASLYALLADKAYHFGPDELDRYDHLFCGTISDRLEGMGMSQENRAVVAKAHALATGDLASLRGFWRIQAGLPVGEAN